METDLAVCGCNDDSYGLLSCCLLEGFYSLELSFRITALVRMLHLTLLVLTMVSMVLPVVGRNLLSDGSSLLLSMLLGILSFCSRTVLCIVVPGIHMFCYYARFDFVAPSSCFQGWHMLTSCSSVSVFLQL